MHVIRSLIALLSNSNKRLLLIDRNSSVHTLVITAHQRSPLEINAINRLHTNSAMLVVKTAVHGPGIVKLFLLENFLITILLRSFKIDPNLELQFFMHRTTIRILNNLIWERFQVINAQRSCMKSDNVFKKLC
jgi:hypothetical protein